ncbi:MAG: hypothetical protein V4850_08130 [Myxococcota bacterium]
MRPSRLIALLVTSTALHLAVLAPGLLAWRQGGAVPEFENQADLDMSEDEEEGDDESAVVPRYDTPFNVSLYVEPVPVPVARAHVEPPARVAPTPAPVVDVPVPVALPLPAEVAVAVPAEEPIPEPLPPVEPPVELALTEADRDALAAMDGGEMTEGTPVADLEDDEVVEAAPTRRPVRSMKRARPRTERHARHAPCPEPTTKITRVAEGGWYIDRDLIEYYATNMAELQKLGVVYRHRDKLTKEPDGFSVRLSRCSVLREGGLRSGDIVHDINGRTIHGVPQAILAYFALRKEPELFVRITRKGEPLVLAYTVEQPVKGRAARKAARKAQAAR